MNMKLIAVSAIFLLAFAGCSSTPTFQTGEDAEITHDGLTRMEGTVMDVVWAREAGPAHRRYGQAARLNSSSMQTRGRCSRRKSAAHFGKKL
jgi:hypothetical protein